MQLKVEHVSIDELSEGPWKATHILRPDLLVLASLIRDCGILSPLIVQEKTGKIIDGNERYRICVNNKKFMPDGIVPVIKLDIDDIDAQMLHLRLNRGRGNLTAKKTSAVVKNIFKSKKYVQRDFEKLLSMKIDEFSLLVDGSLLKSKSISDHSYSRAWVPVEADPNATSAAVSIEKPPNRDR